MNTALQIILATLATVSAIASAIAAWNSQTSAREALNFQKRLSKHQDSLFLMRSTIDSLWKLKRILNSPGEVADNEFEAFEAIHAQIKKNLESLTQSCILPPRESKLFAAQSFGEIVDQMPNANEEIDIEIKRLQAKIDEIFS